MDALIDMVLETVLRSAIWRSTWYLSVEWLIALALICFLILAWRRRRSVSKRKTHFRYRSKYPK